ncbi:TSUP family transporter [Nocardiopsis sp. CNT-189]|uniref:sulfite exporter TauE/SafE family protein n=1 Tax=Nocardiopsis oceanisediminis TaxID=2816862 RepID=UPI003B371620
MDAGPWMLLLLVAGGFAAGLIDAIVGGGGLLQLPVLLSVMPGGTAVPLGVNKSVSAVGNVASAAVYWRRNPGSRIDLRLLAWSGGAAVGCAMLGAWIATGISMELFRPLVIAALLAVLGFTVRGWVKEARGGGAAAGAPENPAAGAGAPGVRGRLAGASAAIGVYDGLIGPATGSFLLLAFRRILGGRLVDALATAKVVQCLMNIGGAAVFAALTALPWPLIALLSAANLTGSAIGARIALSRGDRLVKTLLVAGVLATVAKLCWDHFS